jgi:DHA2 family multidrug resistance protein
MWMLSDLNPNTSADSMFWGLLLRGACMAFMFLPMTLATIGPLPKHEISKASGFFNLTRQLGGSVGVAAITVFVTRREDFHRQILVPNVNEFNPVAQNYINQFTQMFMSRGYDATTAKMMAYKAIDNMVNGQAMVQSFAEVFLVVAVIFILSMVLLFFLGSGKGKKDVAIEAH